MLYYSWRALAPLVATSTADALLPRYQHNADAILMLYCFTALLLYCFTALLMYCCTALLVYYSWRASGCDQPLGTPRPRHTSLFFTALLLYYSWRVTALLVYYSWRASWRDQPLGTPRPRNTSLFFTGLLLYNSWLVTALLVYYSSRASGRDQSLGFIGLLVDKDNLINYQLVISYGLFIRILTYQQLNQLFDNTIVLSTNCWYRRVCGW